MRNNQKLYRSESDQIVSQDSSEFLESERLESGDSSSGLFSRLKSSLRRRLGGFDINGDGNIDIQEHDAKRLAASHGFSVDKSLSFSTSPDLPARGTVDLHEIESLAREHGWNRTSSIQTPPAQSSFDGLQARAPKAPAQPGLDDYWNNNMGGSTLPKTSIGNMSIDEDANFLKKNIRQQPNSKIFDTSFAFEVSSHQYSKNSLSADSPTSKSTDKQGKTKGAEDHFSKSKPSKAQSKFDQFIEKIIKAILGAILSFLGFRPSRNDMRSKKLQKYRKNYRK